MQKTDCEWLRNPDGSVGYEWNPVRGCNRLCDYCRARAQNAALAENIIQIENQWRVNWRTEHPQIYPDAKIPEVSQADISHFTPAFLWSGLYQEFPSQPSRIYVGSMSGINYWSHSWLRSVPEKIAKYPQHTFFFLSKNISTYKQFNFPSNCWLGVSVDTQARINNYQRVYSSALEKKDNWFSNRFFIVFEPLLEAVWSEFIEIADWVIIGALTGKLAGQYQISQSWIELIRQACGRVHLEKYNKKIPLFMRDNLQPAWDTKLIREFPDFQ